MAWGMSLAAGGAHAEIRLGGWLGANTSTLRFEEAPPGLGTKSATLVSGGVILAWRAGERFSLELRPGSVGRGADVQVEGVRTEIRSRSFEVPLLAAFDLTRGRVRPYLTAGLAVGFRSSATATSPRGEEDIAGDFESTETSLRAGAGVRFGAVAGVPFLEIEYAQGLNDLNAQRTGLGTGLGAIRSRGVEVRAGFSFPLGGK
jgi:hypothetical protein